MKKFLACLLATLTLLTSFSVCMVYAEEESDFTYKTQTNWETDTVEVHITGYNGSDSVVTIPDTIAGYPVTVIDSGAFQGNETITSVTVPSSVTEIETYAFEDCTNLSELKLPENIYFFGRRAIKNTAIYNDSKNWDGNVLYFNNFLIEASMDIEGEYKVKDGTTLIAGGAFTSNRDITSVIFPSSLKYVNDNAFQFCRNIEKVTLNEGLEVIDRGALSYTSISEIKFPQSLRVIGNGALSDTNITKLHFPANVEVIDETAFTDVELKEVTVDSNNKNYYVTDGVLFERYEFGDVLLCYPALKEGDSYTIPEGTYDIGFAAFTGVKNLKVLNIPASLNYFFIYKANSIEKFTVDTANENYYSVNDSVYRKLDKELIAYPSAKQGETFTTAEGTENVSFSVIQNNPYLKEITFTEGIKSIDSAISNCENLETVNFPSTLEYLSVNVISNCPKLKAINFKGTMAEFKAYNIYLYSESKTGLYAYCTDGTIELIAPEGTTTPTEPEEVTTAPTTAPEEITTTATEPSASESVPAETTVTTPAESTATEPSENTTETVPEGEFELGDVNKDSKLNIRDATAIQKHLAKISTLSEDAVSLADYTKDGKVNIKDATTIQKKIAGLI